MTKLAPVFLIWYPYIFQSFYATSSIPHVHYFESTLSKYLLCLFTSSQLYSLLPLFVETHLAGILCTVPKPFWALYCSHEEPCIFPEKIVPDISCLFRLQKEYWSEIMFSQQIDLVIISIKSLHSSLLFALFKFI